MDAKTANEKTEKADKPAGEKKNGDTKKASAPKEEKKEASKDETPKKGVKEQTTVPATITTEGRVEGKKVSEETKSEPTETLRIETDGSGSWVEFHIEMTLNIGNMEFAKIHIGRRAPHKATETDADNAIKVVKAWARREFREEVQGVRKKVSEAAEKRKEQRKPKK